MTATAWTAAELDAIDATGEVDVATRRADGTLRSQRIVWIVRHRGAGPDGDRDGVYVRSVNGVDAAWYRGVQTRHEGQLTAGRLRRDVVFVETGQHAEPDNAPGGTALDGDALEDAALEGAALDDALDEAYRVKYGRSSSAVAHITADTARATTLRVDPA
ncbi:DUF2255 family protein [uncultured Jatrophihabitans sp.]|uniref:DUF2255 family protein n=1 Tax=uncultured Jatrophihabitans sp. TaxID=1610747 RepID=UPI0035CAAA3C